MLPSPPHPVGVHCWLSLFINSLIFKSHDSVVAFNHGSKELVNVLFLVVFTKSEEDGVNVDLLESLHQFNGILSNSFFAFLRKFLHHLL